MCVCVVYTFRGYCGPIWKQWSQNNINRAVTNVLHASFGGGKHMINVNCIRIRAQMYRLVILGHFVCLFAHSPYSSGNQLIDSNRFQLFQCMISHFIFFQRLSSIKEFHAVARKISRECVCACHGWRYCFFKIHWELVKSRWWWWWWWRP